MYSCGKFLSNILSFNSKVFPQVPHSYVDTLIKEDLLSSNNAENLNNFKKQSIFRTLPSNKDECQQWSKFELGDIQFWNFFDDDFLNSTDLNFLDSVSPLATLLLSNDYYCFMTCHDPYKYKKLISSFPNAQTITLTNDKEVNQLSVKLKTDQSWYPEKIPPPENSLYFDIGSIFNQEEFFINVANVLIQVGIDDLALDKSVYDYYNRYMELYK